MYDRNSHILTCCQECIAANRDDARVGVSRPQIKKSVIRAPFICPLLHLPNKCVHRFVETTYNLDLGPAQVTQLNKAISNGADKGTFYLPKGMLVTTSVRYPLTLFV